MSIIKFIELFLFGILIILVTKYLLVWSIKKIAVLFNLNVSTIGAIEGYATSSPELISTIFLAYLGLINTATYNVLSSNIINIVLFIISVLLFNKTKELFKRKYYKYYLLILLSVILPYFILNNKINSNIILVPVFIILYILFLIYINKKDKKNISPSKTLNYKVKFHRYLSLKFTRYLFVLILSIFCLYFFGEVLGNIIESLFSIYGIPESALGIIIGIITSLPEFTTFIFSQSNYGKNNTESNNLSILETLNNLLSSNVSNILIVQTIGIIIYNI